MAKGYIFDKLLNRKIEGETNLTSLDEINEVINKNAEVAEDLEMLVAQVDRNTENRGTKLYLHDLSFTFGGSNNIELAIISTISVVCDDYSKFRTLLESNLSCKEYGTPYDVVVSVDEELVEPSSGSGSTTLASLSSVDLTNFTDTVTPL